MMMICQANPQEAPFSDRYLWMCECTRSLYFGDRTVFASTLHAYHPSPLPASWAPPFFCDVAGGLLGPSSNLLHHITTAHIHHRLSVKCG